MKKTSNMKSECLFCKEGLAGVERKYCSNICQFSYQRSLVIKSWKRGEITGLNKLGLVSRPIKIYLREKFDNKCVLCGWSKVNPKTGLVPLVADHIDGNWRNNKESNLRLICPNCDSLNPTYAGLNKGNGRIGRRPSKRAEQAKEWMGR